MSTYYTPKRTKNLRLIIIIFILAGALRLSLSVVNYQANDNHFPVINTIKNQGVLPTKADAWEGFQPKLYHCTVAYISKLIPFQYLPIKQPKAQFFLQIVLAQLLNSFAGMVTLYIVWLFLKDTALSEKVKLISLGMVALTPGLMAINAQATNDSFVIMFSTAAIYSVYLFFKRKNNKYFFYVTMFSILAGLLKGNGLVLFPAVVLVFVLKMAVSKNVSLNPKKSYPVFIVCFVTVYLAIVPSLGQYYYNYRTFGSPFVSNMDPDPFPDFITNTYVHRPGVTSIVSSYCTFRIINMLKYPMTQHAEVGYPLHRTSLWSQVYGGTHFIFFNMHPPLWRNSSNAVLNIGRVILILALFPAAALLLGIITEAGMWIKNIAGMNFAFIADTDDWIFDIFLCAYILFIMYYTSIHRDFSTMKAIFIYPALLPATHLFSKGIERIYRSSQTSAVIFDSSIGALALLYVVSSSILICQLAGTVKTIFM